ncbi:hypothetical protein [Nocardiopsis alba]|nr:hypothetical protein [Nocardiopsis alba]
MRKTMRNIIRITSIATAIALIPMSATSSALALPGQRTGDLDSLGTSRSNEERSSGLSAEANSAERSSPGSLVSITWSVKNEGGDHVDFNWPQGTSYMYNNSTSYSGVTIINEGTKYHPLMDSNGECLCSGNTSLEMKNSLKPGEQVAYWSMFSVPSDVDTITLEIPGFDPIEDIPIS